MKVSTYDIGTGEDKETEHVIWLSMGHWKKTAITKHVQIEGWDHGYTFLKGKDSAVCTIQGIVPWTKAGIAELDELDGGYVIVEDDVEGEHSGISTVTITNGGNHSWISFTMTVTEV